MKSCTFFGHRVCPCEKSNVVWEKIEELIVYDGVTCFYVGCHGEFDAIVRGVLKQLKKKYPQIRYYIFLAYMPGKNNNHCGEDTILPSGIENIPKKFAISYRNQWMIEQSEYVITYVTHSFGGAAQFEAMAQKKGKRIIKISLS